LAGLETDLLSYERIAHALSRLAFVRRIEYQPSVGSTNDLAKQLGAQGAPEATLVIADEQTAGRGRLGRAWWTPPGVAIAMSLLVRPQLHVTAAYRLTMLAGLAAAEAVEQVTGLPVGLKWPNDIVIEHRARGAKVVRKLGGILTETSIAGQSIEFVVVGIGLNVNVDLRARPDLPEATSLMMELGHQVDRLSIVHGLIERFAARYAEIDHDERLRADWSARLTTLGHRVAALRGAQVFEGLAVDVDESGALLIRSDDGALHRIDAADVTLRL